MSGPWDGRSWTAAFGTVQQGVDRAAEIVGMLSGVAEPSTNPETLLDPEARTHAEVWVAEGVYKPTEGADRAAVIRLRPGVALYGGFAGTETERDQRDWLRHETVLSGAISDDTKGHSLHVVTGADDAVIDGFTIRDGYNMPEGPRPHHMSPGLLLESQGRGTGAGMLNDRCAPTVRNCLICDNVASKGAGMYNMVTRTWPAERVEKAPLVVNCIFARNFSEGRGGAVSNDLETHPTFVGCTFIDNRCDGKGGGMYNDFDCSPELVSCLFARNEAMKGGAMANDGRSNPTITNCTFARNHARTCTAPSTAAPAPRTSPTCRSSPTASSGATRPTAGPRRSATGTTAAP